MNRPHILHRIADVMHRIAPTARTIIYGSEARGDARPDSDIDLLVLLDDTDTLTPERELDITRQLYLVELETGIIISPIVMLKTLWENQPLKTPFYINVTNEGVAL